METPPGGSLGSIATLVELPLKLVTELRTDPVTEPELPEPG